MAEFVPNVDTTCQRCTGNARALRSDDGTAYMVDKHTGAPIWLHTGSLDAKRCSNPAKPAPADDARVRRLLGE